MSSSRRPRITGEVHYKIVCAAWLIAHSPDDVFDLHNELSEAARASAQPMVESLLYAVNAMSSAGGGLSWEDLMAGPADSHRLAKELPMRMTDYLRSFKAWNIEEVKRLADRITAVLHEIDRVEQYLPADESGAGKRAQLQERRECLKRKLEVVAGVGAVERYTRQRVAEALVPSASGGSAFDVVVCNENMVWEMLMNPSFKLGKRGEQGDELISTLVRPRFPGPFWDGFRAELLDSASEYTCMLSVIDEFHDCKKRFFPDPPALDELQRIESLLSVDVIKQKVAGGAMDLPGLGALADCMAGGLTLFYESLEEEACGHEAAKKWSALKAQMPDEAQQKEGSSLAGETLHLWTAKAWEFIAGELYNMRVIAANKKLDSVRGTIAANGVVFLRQKFNNKLASDSAMLNRTSEWIKRAVADGDPRLSLDDITSGPTDGLRGAVVRACTDVVVEYPDWRDRLPEVLEVPVLWVKALHRHFCTDVKSQVFLAAVAEVRPRAPLLAPACTTACAVCMKIDLLALGRKPKSPSQRPRPS